jgi:hypothetical protein
MVEHVSIADPGIHEPKGVSTASSGSVYVANGAGGGSWQKITSSSFNTSEVDDYIQGNITDGSYDLGTYFTVNTVLDDVSAANDTAYIPIPNASIFVSASAVLEGAITSSDAYVTFYNRETSTGTPMTVTQSGSAAGDYFSYTPTSNTEFTDSSYLKIVSGGESNTSRRLWITAVFQLA